MAIATINQQHRSKERQSLVDVILSNNYSCQCCISSDESSADDKVRLLWKALALVGCLAIIELIVGRWSHSLALVADSGHMVADGLALGVSLLAAYITQIPAWRDRQLEVLAALANGISLVVIAAWIAWEAFMRLRSPAIDILSLPMLVTAVTSLAINSLNMSLLHGSSNKDLNMRGAFLHVVADTIGSIGIILAAMAVWLLHWVWADGLISLLVSGAILLGAIPLISQSCNILFHPSQRRSQLQTEAAAKNIVLSSKLYSLEELICSK